MPRPDSGTTADRRRIGMPVGPASREGPKKGSGTKSAKHPKGRSGFWFLTPFSSVTIDRNSEV